MSNKIEFIVLLYPNNTTVKVEGDPDIISQIVKRLGDQTIGFEIHERFDVTDGWNVDALRALMKDSQDGTPQNN